MRTLQLAPYAGLPLDRLNFQQLLRELGLVLAVLGLLFERSNQLGIQLSTHCRIQQERLDYLQSTCLEAVHAELLDHALHDRPADEVKQDVLVPIVGSDYGEPIAPRQLSQPYQQLPQHFKPCNQTLVVSAVNHQPNQPDVDQLGWTLLVAVAYLVG